MRSAIVLSGFAALVAAQSTESSIGLPPDVQSSVSAALASQAILSSQYFATATGAAATMSYTPEELSSMNSVAYSIATAAIGSQSSIISAGEVSVLAAQALASQQLDSVTQGLATATGEAAQSLASASSSLVSVITSASAANSAGTMPTDTSGSTGGVAPTARPVIAAGAVGAVGLAVLGLL